MLYCRLLDSGHDISAVISLVSLLMVALEQNLIKVLSFFFPPMICTVLVYHLLTFYCAIFQIQHGFKLLSSIVISFSVIQLRCSGDAWF